MQTITDVHGRSYRLELTLGGCYLIKAETGLDLLRISEDADTLNALGQRSEKLLRAVWSLLKPQAQEAGVACELEWLNGFDGATARAAEDAFLQELIFFTRALRGEQHATRIEKMIQTTQARWSLVHEVAVELEGETDPAQQRQVIREHLRGYLRATLPPPGGSNSPGNVPAS